MMILVTLRVGLTRGQTDIFDCPVRDLSACPGVTAHAAGRVPVTL
jgi:hypothetical protein